MTKLSLFQKCKLRLKKQSLQLTLRKLYDDIDMEKE